MTTAGGTQGMAGQARHALGRARQELAIVRTSLTERRKGTKELGLLGDLVTRWLGSDSPLLADERVKDSIVAAFERLYTPFDEGDLPTPVVRRAIVDQFHRLYYHDSWRTWRQTTHRGVTVYKCPLDLWIYQEIINEIHPDLIIETGTALGGSAYFMADLCDTLGKGHVVSIDIEDDPGRPSHPRVTYLTGSSVDPNIVEQALATLPPGGTAMVILDSDHSMEHVKTELNVYAPVVTLGSYLVVEDTNVHGHPALPSFPAGPMEGLQQFLTTTDEFEVDTNQEKFMLTFNPSGFLKRVKDAPRQAS
jgi:cephalosporin hydroxylase